jgi:hypothetical protein
MELRLRDAKIIAEGEVDFRGTLAVAKDVTVGLRNLRLRFELDSDEPRESLEKLIQLTERYCVVLQSLRQPPRVEVAVGVVGREEAGKPPLQDLGSKRLKLK